MNDFMFGAVRLGEVDQTITLPHPPFDKLRAPSSYKGEGGGLKPILTLFLTPPTPNSILPTL